MVCIECVEPLSFDSPAENENDVVRKSPISIKVYFVSARKGLDPETSCTAIARSSHSATKAPQQGQPPTEIHPLQ